MRLHTYGVTLLAKVHSWGLVVMTEADVGPEIEAMSRVARESCDYQTAQAHEQAARPV